MRKMKSKREREESMCVFVREKATKEVFIPLSLNQICKSSHAWIQFKLTQRTKAKSKFLKTHTHTHTHTNKKKHKPTNKHFLVELNQHPCKIKTKI